MHNFEEELATLNRSLTNQSPSAKTQLQIVILREAAKMFAAELVSTCPTCREKSLAKTHLEEALMWAVKALVLNPIREA